jgi:DNA mismatch repair protein MutL
VNLFGSNYNERLVPVHEETTLMNISGFVGKPEFAKKSRGEQFFFVNKRFIKDAYLHHAVQNAFEELLPRESFASYWLYFDIDPKKIDINIHPTKTEIKFEDERSIYSIVRSAVKRSLGQYSVTPSLDFDQEKSFDLPFAMRNAPVHPPTISVNTQYNPFHVETKKISTSGWEKLYEGLKNETPGIETLTTEKIQPLIDTSWGEELKSETNPLIFQLHERYLVTQIKTGLMIIDQQSAHERILYEKYLQQIVRRTGPAQQSLFPLSLEFSSGDYQQMIEMLEDVRSLGFDLREFGANTFVLHGSPVDVESGKEKEILESLLEQFKNSQALNSFDHQESVARSMARKMAIKAGRSLTQKEMKNFRDELFACEKPFLGVDGKPTVFVMNMDELRKLFSR